MKSGLITCRKTRRRSGARLLSHDGRLARGQQHHHSRSAAPSHRMRLGHARLDCSIVHGLVSLLGRLWLPGGLKAKEKSISKSLLAALAQGCESSLSLITGVNCVRMTIVVDHKNDQE